VKKLVSLLALFLTSCITTPGIKEPDIFIYTIVSSKELDGENTYDPQKQETISIIDAIGFQCTPPKATATIKSHHEILHKRLNKELERKNLNNK